MIKRQDIYSAFSFKGKDYHYVDYKKCHDICTEFSIDILPYSVRVLLENTLRHASSTVEITQTLKKFSEWGRDTRTKKPLLIKPTRILLQDYTGIPVLVDLCALRHSVALQYPNTNKARNVNPVVPIDLVVDHSIVTEYYGNSEAITANSIHQYKINRERFAFLKWASKAFDNLRVTPPGSGICHQVNLELLSNAYSIENVDGRQVISPELMIGADSHTPMINALGVLGWGVGGVEALHLSLGGALETPLPEVVGIELNGQLSLGVTATDCVLHIAHMLRAHGVVNKFIEFFGSGVETLSVPDRATIANMTPEFGATCSFFPWDQQVLRYLTLTGREGSELLEVFAPKANLWRDYKQPRPVYSETIVLNLSTIEPILAGPNRPEQRLPLKAVPASFLKNSEQPNTATAQDIPNGAVLLAAITSCTNTANPTLILTAALLAKKAVAAGLKVPDWVKTTFTPGSLVVGDYLQNSGLQKYLDALGFQICGYGCATCIGNSGALLENAVNAIEHSNLTGCAVLSGNRNFRGRIHPAIKYNYLGSPPLVVAYALAGRITCDLTTEPLGKNQAGQPVFLNDIWPTSSEVNQLIEEHLSPQIYIERKSKTLMGLDSWQEISYETTDVYAWDEQSGYIAPPPFFYEGKASSLPKLSIQDARPLLILGDGITTDDISPASNIQADSQAGKYLASLGVSPNRMHTFGSRRGHWKVMLKGAFSNKNLTNELTPDRQGAFTRILPGGEELPLLEAAELYSRQGIATVIIAGKNYGTGSSRDDAARSTRLLAVSAVIAESFERIHRSNLALFGVFPLTFRSGESHKSLKIDGSEMITIELGATPPVWGTEIECSLTQQTGAVRKIKLVSALRENEIPYFKRGGVLPYIKDAMCAQLSAHPL